MASLLTLGIAAITVGAVAGDGGPGTSLTALGMTYQDSCKLNEDDPTTTEFFSEELEQAVYTNTTGGKITLTFQVMDPDVDVLQRLFGGTVTGTTTKTWDKPSATPTIIQTVKLVPKSGLTVVIPRGAITAKLNGEFSKKNLFLIDVTVTALAPTKANTGAIQFLQAAA